MKRIVILMLALAAVQVQAQDLAHYKRVITAATPRAGPTRREPILRRSSAGPEPTKWYASRLL